MADIFQAIEEAIPAQDSPTNPATPATRLTARLEELRSQAEVEAKKLEAEASRLSAIAGSWVSLSESTARARQRHAALRDAVQGLDADVERLAGEIAARFDEAGFPVQHVQALANVTALQSIKKTLLRVSEEKLKRQESILETFIAENRGDLRDLGAID